MSSLPTAENWKLVIWILLPVVAKEVAHGSGWVTEVPLSCYLVLLSVDGSWRCSCLVTWFCYQLMGHGGAAALLPGFAISWWVMEVQLPCYLVLLSVDGSWRCSCLVTWFCYQLIAKPGNKTAAPSWPNPHALVLKFEFKLEYLEIIKYSQHSI